MLRFDFTGLGASEGEFANTTFSSNVDDLVAAADHLRRTLAAPAILIGHSLGGAAVLAAAHRIPEARAVVTIDAPFDPAHVAGLFRRPGRRNPGEGRGRSDARRAGRSAFAALSSTTSPNRGSRAPVASLRKALLVFHAPTDDIVGIENASHIFTAAKHPKSFISLAGADHLVSRPGDAAYVANVIAAWAERYLDAVADVRPELEPRPAPSLCAKRGHGVFQQEIIVRRHIVSSPTSR